VSLTIPYAQFFENYRGCRKCGVGYLNHGVIGDPIPEFVKESFENNIKFYERLYGRDKFGKEIGQLETFLKKEKFDHNFQEPPSNPPSVVGNSLEDYYTIKKFLDKKFGGPRISVDDRNLYDGSDTFFIILEHIANHGPSTCKQIAESWYNQNNRRNNNKRNIKNRKSIRDQISRFLKDYDSLKIFEEIVKKEKSNGRPPKIYRLNEFGILYSIYCFSKSHEDWKIINNLAKKHSNIIPLIFSNFFERSKIFENYKDECLNAFKKIADQDVIRHGYDVYIEDTAIVYQYISTMKHFSREDLVNQIAVAFYVRLWSEIQQKCSYLFVIKQLEKSDEVIKHNEPNEARLLAAQEFNRRVSEYREMLADEERRSAFDEESQKVDMEANKKWLKILESDSNLNRLIQDVLVNGSRLDRKRISIVDEILEIFPSCKKPENCTKK